MQAVKKDYRHRKYIYPGKINFKRTEATFAQQADSRVATLSFTYRFGKPIKGVKKRNSGGAGTEQNRVKGTN